jgi:hypothetical protein
MQQTRAKPKPVAVPPKADDFPELPSCKSSSPPTAPKAMNWASVVTKKEPSPPPAKVEIKEEANTGPKRLVDKRFGAITPHTAVKEEAKFAPKRLAFTKRAEVAYDEDFDNDDEHEDYY